MKSILIIGMGRFGHHLCRNLAELGNQIMIVDEVEERLEPMLPYVVSAKIGDCTNEAVLESLGISNFDICFVCIGTNFQSSLEITSMVKEMGAKWVVSKASRDIHAKFLLRNGADEVIYPDRDLAEKMAVRYSANHVFDYIELTDEFSIYEIPPMSQWVGKSI
ncbi:MAG: TrkA family potassium uptake protein, partial [Lachnospiraceae bacterium]|nr:TrkA family potassium uptake protein [Lachnospiraceae bacterium]